MTTEGISKNLAITSEDNLESEIIISGLYSVLLGASLLSWLDKFVNQLGIFAILCLIENPSFILHTNSTGGTVTHSYPCIVRYPAASPNEENFISTSKFWSRSATIISRLAWPSPTP